MPRGKPKNGINSGWFKKGYIPKTAFKKGDIAWAKGRKFSHKHIENLRKSHLGKKQSEEIKRKRMESESGSKHWNWKGGLTPLMCIIRRCFKYRQWRSDIFTRDNFTCQICTKRGGWIEADHIEKFSVIFYRNKIKTLQEALDCEELWNINNGRTLCRECHKKTNTFGIKKHIDNDGIQWPMVVPKEFDPQGKPGKEVK
jgi:hypothetical protein